MYSLVKSSMINTLSGTISLAAGFGSTVVIARLLGAEGTGLTAFCLWLVFSGYALADRGVPAIVLRYLSRTVSSSAASPNLVRQLYGRFIWPVLLIGVAFSAYGVSPHAAAAGNPGSIWYITAIIFLVYCHAQLATSASFANGDYLSPAKKAALGCLLQLPAVAVGAYWFGAPGAMAGYLLRHLPQALSVHSYLQPGASQENCVTPKMLEYGNHSWLSAALVILVWSRTEFLFIGWFFSLTEVGYFAAGVTFTSLVYQMALSMTAGMTPKFGHLLDTGETAKLEKSYQRVLRWMAFFLLPVSLGGAVIMQEIIPLVLGLEFAPAVPSATVLMAFVFGGCFSMVPTMIMQATEHSKVILWMNAISAAVLIVLNLVFTPLYGVLAAAWIKGIVSLADLVFALWYCQARLGYSCGLGSLMKLFFSALACAAMAWAILLQLDGLPGLVLSIPAAAVIYMVAIRLTGAMPSDDLDVLRGSIGNALPAPLSTIVVRLVSLVEKP